MDNKTAESIRAIRDSVSGFTQGRRSGSLTIHFSQGSPVKTEVRLVEKVESTIKSSK